MDCKCKIVSDGTPRGTKVFDASGKEVDLGICRIDIHAHPRDVIRATITVVAPHLDIVALGKIEESGLNG